jgi:predicted methyltransferase
MKSGKAVCRYFSIALLAFSVWYALPHLGSLTYAKTNAEGEQAGHQESAENCINPAAERRGESAPTRPKDRAESLRAIASYLGLGRSSTIADIGAGNGRDTWVFAEIVGEGGKVYPEEIGEDLVRSLKASAEQKKLTQVSAALGRSDDPCLPADSIDLAYMNRVYHHFAKPREMLRGIWRSLKPGGYLVIVDQRRGTLRDWVPRHVREEKHYWIAETTVVREAREEGFAFYACAEQLWHEDEPFVLVFRRPEKSGEACRDPDMFQPISVENWGDLFLLPGGRYQNPVFIALGQARELMVPILEHSSSEGLDIVLEEWATQKDERPFLPAGLFLPSILTKDGDPNLPDKPVDAVFFLDSYHLLFHGETLLARLHEKLMPTGRVFILDRPSRQQLSRREASHRRQISPKMVEEEMNKAGFRLLFRGPRLARDRFLLIFGEIPQGTGTKPL